MLVFPFVFSLFLSKGLFELFKMFWDLVICFVLKRQTGKILLQWLRVFYIILVDFRVQTSGVPRSLLIRNNWLEKYHRMLRKLEFVFTILLFLDSNWIHWYWSVVYYTRGAMTFLYAFSRLVVHRSNIF